MLTWRWRNFVLQKYFWDRIGLGEWLMWKERNSNQDWESLTLKVWLINIDQGRKLRSGRDVGIIFKGIHEEGSYQLRVTQLSCLFPFERMSPSSLQSAIKFSFTFCPVFVETNFSRRVGVITAFSCYRDPSQVSSGEYMILPSAEVERTIECNRLHFPLSFYPS